MVLSGASTDTRVLVESFLQANIKMRSRYKCAVMHCCVRENKLSQDTYYIVKHIMYQIVRTVPAVRLFLMLQKHNYFQELLTTRSTLNQRGHTIQWEPADSFVKFCRILCQLKLDFNVGVVVTGVENLFDKNDLQNFIYILRSAMVWCPPFLRFLLTIQPRDSKAYEYEKIIQIMAT